MYFAHLPAICFRDTISPSLPHPRETFDKLESNQTTGQTDTLTNHDRSESFMELEGMYPGEESQDQDRDPDSPYRYNTSSEGSSFFL